MERVSRPRPAQNLSTGNFERLVDVGGHRLYVKCVGSGAPTVILESGLGSGLDDWWRVQPEVARFMTVCSYDRANLPTGKYRARYEVR